MIILNHFTITGLDEFQPQVQDNIFGDKPNGLWLCEEDAWMDFLEQSLNPADEYLQHAVAVDLTKLLVLDTPANLCDFAAQYGLPSRYEDGVIRHIDWARVAENYSGIWIKFYVPLLCREKVARWHYTWDIPSACIWQSDAIMDVGEAVQYRFKHDMDN